MNSGSLLEQVALVIVILLFGHLAAKASSLILRKFFTQGKENLTKKDIENRLEAIKYFGYTIDSAAIILALLYLNRGINSEVIQGLTQLIPEILSAILVVILGFLVINISTKIGADFFRTLGVKNYFREIGLSESAFKLVAGLFKGFLYLLLLQISLTQLGIGDTFVSEIVTASSWAAAFMIAGLLFYGFKDLFQNYAAGIYLKNSRTVRPGEEIKLEEEKGEISSVSLFSTTVDTDTGYTLMTPNKEVMESNIKLKRTKSDVETLEDIKNHFVAQNPSYCGPASMEMALDVFGYRYDQDEIGEISGTEEGEGVEVEPLMEASEELTDGEVKTAFIEYDKVTDLADEFKAWFNDGALIIPNFYKPELFPSQETYGGHYVLSTGVEDEEILVVDPSDRSGSGGVYYVNGNKMYDAMGDHGHKRGYIVVAPEGTTAYWRIKQDLIYSDRTYYDELSKTLESRLRKILRQGKIIGDITPSSVEKYMEKWRKEGNISRLWSSEGGDDEASKYN